MRTSKTLKQQILCSLGPIIGALLVLYFGFHIISGSNGILALVELETQLAQSKSVLKKLKSNRERLQHVVDLLRGPSFDPDFLEERARIMAGLSRNEDIIIFLPRSKQE